MNVHLCDRRRGKCSTPLGVTDLVTPARIEVGDRIAVCSTPLGVTDLVTPRSPSPHRRPHTCSTPLGVTDLVTRSPECAVSRRRQVLNASRRHRLGHGAHLNRKRRSGAKVLNASRRHRLGHNDATIKRLIKPGAQRLSASQTWSLAVLMISALRGSRCSTPLGVTDLVTRGGQVGPDQRPEVLNASRRHRLGHTADLCLPQARRDVLNASRRHRLGHSVCGALINSRTRVLNASRRHRLGHDIRNTLDQCAEGAQRLSASQTWSLQQPALPGRHGQVLNASRRHRLGHGRAGQHAGRPGLVLNASRRHRLGHGVVGRGGPERRPVLNASRRHRLGHDEAPKFCTLTI